jgi:ribonuclease HI
MKHWRSVFSITMICAVPVSCLMIVLQFDGSLRKPTDVGAPTAMLGQMAACACIIRPIDDSSGYPSLLGGKRLSATSSTTSGEVEYEGLLLGLQSLRTYLAEYVNVTNSKHWTIVVQGDCKNILNQMSGRAAPRKLENFHRLAEANVHSIEERLSLSGSTCTFRFEHITRTSNVLCDRLSALIIAEQQRKALDDVWNVLSTLENTLTYAEARGVEGILDRWFQLGRSIIPLTMRPNLYQRMASIAIAMQDFSGLLTLSLCYEDDVRILQKNKSSRRQSNNMAHGDHISYGASVADAVSYQIAALKALGRLKESVRVQQKNRILLQTYPRNITQKELQQYGFIESERSADQVDWSSPVLCWKTEAFASTNWHKNCEYVSLQYGL